jgi:hypothetical protein
LSLAALAICLGCSRQELPPTELADLPRLRQTHHGELRAELARLQAERATPELLEADERSAAGGQATDPDDPCADLNAVVSASELKRLLQRIERYYPPDAFAWDPVRLEKARATRSAHSHQRDAYRAALENADFKILISLSQGLLADLTAQDHARLAHRLEALDVAEILATGPVSSAMLSLRRMLAIDTALATVAHVSTRLLAAHLRRETLAIVAALVQHPSCTREVRQELLALLEDQLARWTPDRHAWMGDRALGLHTFELVREGQLLSVLTEEEIMRLQRRGDLEAFVDAVMESLDEDQWFYLKTMRRVIEACQDPYFQRITLLNELNAELQQLENTPRFPLFSATVLLPDLAAVQREQAADRARCEAWVVALRAAVGATADASLINPVTGEGYALRQDARQVVVEAPADATDLTEVLIPLQP